MEAEPTRNLGKVGLWIALGCLGILTCAILVLVFGFGGLFWLGSQSPEEVSVQVDAPSQVTSGGDFTIKVDVTNTGGITVVLTNIDFSMNYLAGFHVVETTPPYTETWQYNALGGGETFQTYLFNQTIDAGETITLLFNTRSLREGDFSGSIAICIDSTFNCKLDIILTIAD